MHAPFSTESHLPSVVDAPTLPTTTKLSRRDELIRVAREEFSRHGFAGASVVSIAARAGIRKSSLFHHFATKEELYDASVRQLVRDVVAAVDASVGRVNGFSPKLTAGVGAMQKTLIAHPPAARLLVRALVDGDPTDSSTAGLLEELVSTLASIIQGGIDETAIPNQDARHAALMLLGVVCFPFARPDLDPRMLAEERFGEALATQVAQGLLTVPRT